jgi:hypothetical protein
MVLALHVLSWEWVGLCMGWVVDGLEVSCTGHGLAALSCWGHGFGWAWSGLGMGRSGHGLGTGRAARGPA